MSVTANLISDSSYCLYYLVQENTWVCNSALALNLHSKNPSTQTCMGANMYTHAHVCNKKSP